MLRTVVLLLALATAARADDLLHPGAAVPDTPTIVTLGVQLLVGFRYRATGAPPVASIVLKADSVTVKGGGASWPFTLANAPQGRGAARLVLGSNRPWCADAPAKNATSDTVDKLVALPKSPPPVGCP